MVPAWALFVSLALGLLPQAALLPEEEQFSSERALLCQDGPCGALPVSLIRLTSVGKEL